MYIPPFVQELVDEMVAETCRLLPLGVSSAGTLAA